MPKTKITDFLPQESKRNKAAVQGYVEPELREKVLNQMSIDKSNGIKMTWDNFLDAACKSYLAERSVKRA